MYQDRTLTCGDCRDTFTFTAGEQEFHASKGFNNDPGRCPACRAARKSSGGGGGGGGYSSGPRTEREMHDAVCAECGKNTQVPFAPSGSRPVYCRDCYSKQSGDGRSGGGGGRSFSGGGGGGGRRNRY